MTAKQAVFAAFRSGNVDLATLREEYRSIQVRKVGKDITQIRFRDSESWMTVEDFASNYLNKILKDLSDQLTSASTVLSPKELLNGLTDECRRSVMQSGVKYALANNLAVDVETYNNVVNMYNQEHTSKVNLATQLDQVSAELSEYQERYEAYKHRSQVREANLQQMKQEILDSATMGMLKRAVVEQKFNDYSV